MDNSKKVTIEYGDGIATVRMCREEKRNAFNMALIEEVTAAANTLRARTDIKVVILAGTEKGFSAGADLGDPLQFDESLSLAEKRHFALLGADMIRAWERLPQATVASVERFAIGGGLSLALSCDFRVMAEGAFLWVPEVQIGANYGWNTVPKVVSMVGPARARRMIMLAEKVSAPHALDWGLVDEVAPEGKTLAHAQVLAERLHAMPSMALQVSKRAINAVANAMSEVSSHGDMEQVLFCFSDWNREKAELAQAVA